MDVVEGKRGNENNGGGMLGLGNLKFPGKSIVGAGQRGCFNANLIKSVAGFRWREHLSWR